MLQHLLYFVNFVITKNQVTMISMIKVNIKLNYNEEDRFHFLYS